jgi:hypothetical protein
MAFDLSKIRSFYSKPQVSVSQTYDRCKIFMTPPDDDLHHEKWEELKEKTNMPQSVTLKYTVEDQEQYMRYKQEYLEQIKGESFKQIIREMWSKKWKAGLFGEMQYLENKYPWLIAEKEETISAQKWAHNAIGSHYINGFKPTKEWLEFMYAVKTDSNLRKLVFPVINTYLQHKPKEALPPLTLLPEALKLEPATKTIYEKYMKDKEEIMFLRQPNEALGSEWPMPPAADMTEKEIKAIQEAEIAEQEKTQKEEEAYQKHERLLSEASKFKSSDVKGTATSQQKIQIEHKIKKMETATVETGRIRIDEDWSTIQGFETEWAVPNLIMKFNWAPDVLPAVPETAQKKTYSTEELTEGLKNFSNVKLGDGPEPNTIQDYLLSKEVDANGIEEIFYNITKIPLQKYPAAVQKDWQKLSAVDYRIFDDEINAWIEARRNAQKMFGILK